MIWQRVLLLETPQIKVIQAMSVDEAIKKLGDHNIAMILSDINLGTGEPGGYDFLKHVKEKHSSIPFYFVSGYSALQEEPKAKGRGANGYFQLPIDVEEVKNMLG